MSTEPARSPLNPLAPNGHHVLAQGDFDPKKPTYLVTLPKDIRDGIYTLVADTSSGLAFIPTSKTIYEDTKYLPSEHGIHHATLAWDSKASPAPSTFATSELSSKMSSTSIKTPNPEKTEYNPGDKPVFELLRDQLLADQEFANSVCEKNIQKICLGVTAYEGGKVRLQTNPFTRKLLEQLLDNGRERNVKDDAWKELCHWRVGMDSLPHELVLLMEFCRCFDKVRIAKTLFLGRIEASVGSNRIYLDALLGKSLGKVVAVKEVVGGTFDMDADGGLSYVFEFSPPREMDDLDARAEKARELRWAEILHVLVDVNDR